MVKKVISDDKKSKKRKNLNSQCEIPSIIVECPSGNKVQYVDDWNFVKLSNNNNNNDDDDDDNGQLSEGISGRRSSLRRNSISLPNLEDFELQIVNVSAKVSKA